MTVSRLTDPEFSGRHLREVLRQRPAQCEAEHYQEGLVVVHDAGVQLAFEGEHPDVPAALAAHARRMRQRIYRAGDRVYCAVGYALANVIIVRCEGALVVVDTTESHTSAAQVWQDFKLAVPELADWPVAALVYSHNHSDHINGARVFVDEARLQSGQTHIIAHASLMKAVTDNASVVAPILATRSVYSFGALLPSGPQGSVSAGIGPRLINSQVSFLPPTLTFEDQLDITLAGLRFEFRHAPSETDDELVVWLPDEQTLLSAEVIQGECLANVHTIRGTRYRDPVQWVDTLDALRATRAYLAHTPSGQLERRIHHPQSTFSQSWAEGGDTRLAEALATSITRRAAPSISSRVPLEKATRLPASCRPSGRAACA